MDIKWNDSRQKKYLDNECMCGLYSNIRQQEMHYSVNKIFIQVLKKTVMMWTLLDKIERWYMKYIES